MHRLCEGEENSASSPGEPGSPSSSAALAALTPGLTSPTTQCASMTNTGNGLCQWEGKAVAGLEKPQLVSQPTLTVSSFGLEMRSERRPGEGQSPWYFLAQG